MQTFDTRHQLHLHGKKIVVLLLLGTLAVGAYAQNAPKENLLDYDVQWIHYGFLIGFHSAKYKTQYADAYASPDLDSLHSIIPGHLPGWKVGFVVDMYLLPYLNFRVLPTVGFYEYDLTYRFRDGTELRELKDPTMVELPIMLKYKSARRGNIAMYVTGGVSPSFEAAGRGDEVDTRQRLELRKWNLSIDAGIGFDLYFPLFKFSPEVRYSWGLRNMLTNEVNDYSLALKRLTFQNISFYVTFEGGPTYLRRALKRKKQ